ncbi:MAG TPA: GerMN domain-containing protein, partial [Chondromyces sp.]|nr:GerMN domain-containing protein [Chondromyces sp.]
VTWTLTQFDSVENIELRVNGQSLKEMPVNGMALNPEGLTRESGINIDTEDAVDVANTRPLTVYYMAQEEEDFYYVPVTKRVSNAEGDNIMAAVEELVEGPSHSSELVSEFLPDAQLLEEPIVQDGKVTLNFNKSILGSFEDKMISESLLNALVLSLTEQPGIKSVAVKVDGESKLVTEKGKPVSESVTRPENVNTGSF